MADKPKPTFRVVFLQQLTGGREVIDTGLDVLAAMILVAQCRKDHDIPGACWYYEPEEMGDMAPTIAGRDTVPVSEAERLGAWLVYLGKCADAVTDPQGFVSWLKVHIATALAGTAPPDPSKD
jgi:hypothetical protein